ncbi:MAG: hypothetical protein IJI14_20075 [Anaerolineaceae bacterium]|nr:hypothetical protein [Anaerolineaceae bacterium]
MSERYTPQDLFTIIDKKLREKNLIPDVVSKSLNEHYRSAVFCTDWGCCSKLSTESGMVILDLYLSGKIDPDEWYGDFPLGVYIADTDDRDSLEQMSVLGADFVWELNDFVNSNLSCFS